MREGGSRNVYLFESKDREIEIVCVCVHVSMCMLRESREGLKQLNYHSTIRLTGQEIQMLEVLKKFMENFLIKTA